MLILREDNHEKDGTVIVDSIKKAGDAPRVTFTLDWEDWKMVENTYWYPHTISTIMRRRKGQTQTLHRYLVELRGFAPPHEDYYVVHYDNNKYNLSKNNLVISVYGGNDYKMPRGVLYDNKTNLYTIVVPNFEEGCMMFRGETDTVHKAILEYREIIKYAYPKFYDRLL